MLENTIYTQKEKILQLLGELSDESLNSLLPLIQNEKEKRAKNKYKKAVEQILADIKPLMKEYHQEIAMEDEDNTWYTWEGVYNGIKEALDYKMR